MGEGIGQVQYPCGRGGSWYHGNYRYLGLAYEESLAYTRGISVDELRSKYGSVSSIPLGRVKTFRGCGSGGLSSIRPGFLFAWHDRQSFRRKIPRIVQILYSDYPLMIDQR